jgi:hypothetical protein
MVHDCIRVVVAVVMHLGGAIVVAALGWHTTSFRTAPRSAVPVCNECEPNSPRAPPLPPEAQRPDGPYDLTMITLFRLAFSAAIGWQSPRPLWDYEGLVEQARRLYRANTSPAERNERVADIFRAFPFGQYVQTPYGRPFQLLRDNKWSMEILGELTSRLFPFLVGPCRKEGWVRDESTGEQWQSKVVIERCRFLEASSCKGMCTGLCRAPSEAFFASIDLPLSMTPNFTDGSCEMVWGRTPQPDDLEGQDLACYAACGLAGLTASTAASIGGGARRAVVPSPVASAASLATATPLRTRAAVQLSPRLMALSEAAARTRSPALGEEAAEATAAEATVAEVEGLSGGDAPTSGLEELLVEMRPAGKAGMGAFAAEAAAAGQWITTYVGAPISLLQSTQRYTESDPEYAPAPFERAGRATAQLLCRLLSAVLVGAMVAGTSFRSRPICISTRWTRRTSRATSTTATPRTT